MRILTGSRGSGKTVELVKEANTLASQGHKVIVLVSRKMFEETFRKYGLDDKIEVVSFNDYQRDRIGSNKYNNSDIVIDQADYFLKDLLGNNVASITVDKENIYEIKREDWDTNGK